MIRLHCNLVPEAPVADVQHRLETIGALCLQRHPVGGSVDVILTDDEEVRRLNRTYRCRDTTTDVLSFSMREGSTPTVPDEVADLPAGEIYISMPQAALQAAELGVDVPDELSRLLVHGLLHLAGHDHPTEHALQAMELLTDEILHAADGQTGAGSIRSGERTH